MVGESEVSRSMSFVSRYALWDRLCDHDVVHYVVVMSMSDLEGSDVKRPALMK